MLQYKGKNFTCYVDLGMDILRGKWKSIIICHLSSEPIRFLELQNRINGISSKILSEQLKHLENENIVKKKIYAETPPKVEYYLTQKGMDLVPAFKIISDWAIKYLEKDTDEV